ncbi:MAG: MopE-related protein, partial [Myxococcota bacterium]
LGCGDDDGDWADDGGLVCESDDECDDGLFCNGIERCAPEQTGASVLGCVSVPPPCAADVCSEERGCVLRCDTDRDGDGAIARTCGGMDCDDRDGRRYPGAAEVCDSSGHDEDCNPMTFGFVDRDGDGWPSSSCCNGVHCGDDCDDRNASVNPIAIEACNGLDDDCDLVVDEACEVSQTELGRRIVD